MDYYSIAMDAANTISLDAHNEIVAILKESISSLETARDLAYGVVATLSGVIVFLFFNKEKIINETLTPVTSAVNNLAESSAENTAIEKERQRWLQSDTHLELQATKKALAAVEMALSKLGGVE